MRTKKDENKKITFKPDENFLCHYGGDIYNLTPAKVQDREIFRYFISHFNQLNKMCSDRDA
jgi:hypothetical protein